MVAERIVVEQTLNQRFIDISVEPTNKGMISRKIKETHRYDNRNNYQANKKLHQIGKEDDYKRKNGGNGATFTVVYLENETLAEFSFLRALTNRVIAELSRTINLCFLSRNSNSSGTHRKFYLRLPAIEFRPYPVDNISLEFNTAYRW